MNAIGPNAAPTTISAPGAMIAPTGAAAVAGPAIPVSSAHLGSALVGGGGWSYKPVVSGGSMGAGLIGGGGGSSTGSPSTGLIGGGGGSSTGSPSTGLIGPPTVATGSNAPTNITIINGAPAPSSTTGSGPIMTEPTEIPGVTPPPDADAIAAQNARDRTASDQRAADDRRAAAAPARTPEPAPVPSPAPTTPPAAAPKPDTGSTAATTPTPAPAPAPAPAAPTTTTYTIKSGDTLTSIGKRFHTTVSNLVKLNSIPNPDLIIAGRTLKVPA